MKKAIFVLTSTILLLLIPMTPVTAGKMHVSTIGEFNTKNIKSFNFSSVNTTYILVAIFLLICSISLLKEGISILRHSERTLENVLLALTLIDDGIALMIWVIPIVWGILEELKTQSDGK